MKPKIIAKNKNHLINLIYEEIMENGYLCDLNHIDVSMLKTMDGLFSQDIFSKFNGDISKWNVSNILSMFKMFKNSEFNGDISSWDTSNVDNMGYMFDSSKFNGDISKWNVSNVEHMANMFSYSEFNGDISNWDVSNLYSSKYMFYDAKFSRNIDNWKPYKLEHYDEMFSKSNNNIPYWVNYDNLIDRNKALDQSELNNELKEELQVKKVKKEKKLKL